MYGDYATVKRLTALGADFAKLQEYCDTNTKGYVILGQLLSECVVVPQQFRCGRGCTPSHDELGLVLFETAVIIPWLLENQENFGPFLGDVTVLNLLG